MGVGAACAFFALQYFQNWTGINGPMQYRFLRCLYSFCLGAIVAELYSTSVLKVPQRLSGSLQILCWSAVVALLYLIDRFDFRSSLLPLLFAVIIALCALDKGSTVKGFLEAPALRWIGERSYSIYMVHAFVAASMSFVVNRFSTSTGVIFDIERPQLTGAAGEILVVFYVACVLILSNWTYGSVEKPWREEGKSGKRLVVRTAISY